jgi:aspartate racemase
MEGPMYRDRLAAAGVEALIPDEEGRELVDRAIYTELAVGTVRPELRHRLVALCREAIERRGADGVILGCTELPLAISQDDLAVPVVDTVRVHVQAILDRALG